MQTNLKVYARRWMICQDHEFRHNSQQAAGQAGENEQEPLEETPLLHRFPENNVPQRNPITTVIVSMLLVVLVSGVIIGVYLLILQSDSENVLPPVEMPLQLISRVQWDRDKIIQPVLSSSFRASKVIVVQTDTEACMTADSCIRILQNMQANNTAMKNFLPYNFLVSSNGQTFEGLGWHRSSPLFPQYSDSALVLGFIGNFTQVPPTRAQIVEANNFFSASVSQQYLEPSFVIIGKKTKETPRRLFLRMSKLPQWSSELSDK